MRGFMSVSPQNHEEAFPGRTCTRWFLIQRLECQISDLVRYNNIDSQSVKSAPHGGEAGYDAGKKIKGRKRHLLVDTMGLLLGVAVTPASTPEREGALTVLGRVLVWFTWLRLLWADAGYTGDAFAGSVRELLPKLRVEIVKRSDDTTGFKLTFQTGSKSSVFT